MVQLWRCRHFQWELKRRTLIMGVVNVTPDSFSDGGQCFDINKAIERAGALFEEGADLIDIGGESSRPGASPVPVDVEQSRVIPVVRALAEQAGLPVSIDTVKYEVARRALEAGAAVINDISGLQREPRLAELAARYQAGLVIMHMRGTAQTMQTQTHYEDLIGEVRRFFETQTAFAIQQGVHQTSLALDPGIGFSKTAEQNLVLLNQLPDLQFKEIPLLLGVSRKSFIGHVTGKPVNERIMGTAAAVTAAILRGASIVRVHDVSAMRDVIQVADAIKRGKAPIEKVDAQKEEPTTNPCG